MQPTKNANTVDLFTARTRIRLSDMGTSAQAARN